MIAGLFGHVGLHQLRTKLFRLSFSLFCRAMVSLNVSIALVPALTTALRSCDILQKACAAQPVRSPSVP